MVKFFYNKNEYRLLDEWSIAHAASQDLRRCFKKYTENRKLMQQGKTVRAKIATKENQKLISYIKGFAKIAEGCFNNFSHLTSADHLEKDMIANIKHDINADIEAGERKKRQKEFKERYKND